MQTLFPSLLQLIHFDSFNWIFILFHSCPSSLRAIPASFSNCNNAHCASPFGLRCTGLHDKRVEGKLSWWLPHCALKSVHLETNAHVEWTARDMFSQVHYGHPFGKQDGDLSKPILESWDNFCSAICNTDKVNPRNASLITQYQRLQIAVEMCHDYNDIKIVHQYEPTHKILNEICMLTQTKAFDISRPDIASLPLDEFNANNSNHVIVREIAFGPLSDRPISLWFNILDKDVDTCTKKEKCRLKRTERQLSVKKSNMIATAQANASYADVTGGHAKFCRSSPISFDDKNHNVERSFDIYLPLDEDCYKLITATLNHQVKVTNSKSVCYKKELNSLQERFNAMKNHYNTLSWPINEGREIVNQNTLVPKIDTPYNIQESTTGKNGSSYQAEIWNSFIQMTSTTFEHDDSTEVKVQNNDKRCNVFAQLSQGVSLSESR